MKRVLTLTALLLGTASAACSGTLVQHAMGETCAPRTPKRIVALEWTYAENLLALGIQPVGVADIKGYQEWVNVTPRFASGVKDVGTRQQPSLEQLRALKPDLIITAKSRAAQNYAALSAIAPTVVFDPYAGDSQYAEMRQTFLTMGRLTGRKNTAQQVLNTLDIRLSRLKQQFKTAGRTREKFIFAQAFTARGGTPTMRLFTKNSMLSQLMEQVGLVNAWTAPAGQYGFTEVSLEPLVTLNTTSFLYVAQKEDNVFIAPSVRPLWDRLPFVKSGHTYALNEKTWTFGGPLSALTLANEVSRAMLGQK